MVMLTTEFDNTSKRAAMDWRTWLKSGERPYFFIILLIVVTWFFVSEAVVFFADSVPNMPMERGKKFITGSTQRVAVCLGFLGFIQLLLYALRYRKNTAEQNRETLSSLKDSSKRILLYGLPALISFAIMLISYMNIKTVIPDITPFFLDGWAADMDRKIFLGHDAWQLFSFVYEIPALLYFIDANYTAWAMFVAGVWFACIALPFDKVERRYQFCFALILLWIFGGNIMAILLSTAGPCYMEYFFNDPNFAVLTDKLASMDATAPINAVQYQIALLENYENPEIRMGGISAMPSLHNGTAFLFLCLFWKFPAARLLSFIFLALTFIGSIVLAWHYAVDAILVFPVAYLAWWVSGKCTQTLSRWQKKTTGV